MEVEPGKYLIRYGRGRASYYLVNRRLYLISRAHLCVFFGFILLCILCNKLASSLGAWGICALAFWIMSFYWLLPDRLTEEQLSKYEGHLRAWSIASIKRILLLPLIVIPIVIIRLPITQWPEFLQKDKAVVTWHCKYCHYDVNSCAFD